MLSQNVGWCQIKDSLACLFKCRVHCEDNGEWLISEQDKDKVSALLQEVMLNLFPEKIGQDIMVKMQMEYSWPLTKGWGVGARVTNSTATEVTQQCNFFDYTTVGLSSHPRIQPTDMKSTNSSWESAVGNLQLGMQKYYFQPAVSWICRCCESCRYEGRLYLLKTSPRINVPAQFQPALCKGQLYKKGLNLGMGCSSEGGKKLEQGQAGCSSHQSDWVRSNQGIGWLAGGEGRENVCAFRHGSFEQRGDTCEE